MALNWRQSLKIYVVLLLSCKHSNYIHYVVKFFLTNHSYLYFKCLSVDVVFGDLFTILYIWNSDVALTGSEFWISCKRLKLLRKAGRLQLIQNSAPLWSSAASMWHPNDCCYYLRIFLNVLFATKFANFSHLSWRNTEKASSDFLDN